MINILKYDDTNPLNIKGYGETLMGKNDFIIENNFPEKGDNRVIHIRPHTSERYYARRC